MNMNNPYIIIGNIILGFFCGWFFSKKLNLIFSAMIAFAIQLPWLVFSDIYLIGMSTNAVYGIVIALLISNLIWAIIASMGYKHIRNLLN
jgi:tetrahydromethanopterin S-methyltransferase subunit B